MAKTIYKFYVWVYPSTYNAPYKRCSTMTEEEAVNKARSEMLRTGKTHYVTPVGEKRKILHTFHAQKAVAI